MAENTRTDGELLAEFATQRSDAAFTELLRRHGKLVLNVCSRVLGNSADAEDAAQAVFLVLAKKSGSLSGHASVAGWLHRTAWNVAQHALTSRSIRKRHEQEAGAMTTSDATAQREWQELAPVLDEELNALPVKTRDAILLFHLEGRTLEETAKTLDCPVGTLGARLSRGRDLLRERLARRGMILSTGLIVLMLDKNASAAELSADFSKTTLKAAHALASGQTGWESLVSSQTHTLTQGALSMLHKARLRILTLAVATAALFLITLGNYSFKAGAEETKSDVAKAAVTPPVPVPSPKGPEVAEVKTVEWKEPADISESNTRFSVGLYGKLAAQEKGNFFVSPFSIQTALAMTYAGANGQTATEMSHALHLASDRKKLNTEIGAYLTTLNTPRLTHEKKPAYQLSVANALWLQQNFPFKQDFLDVNQKTYGAGANLLDFKQNVAAAKTINDWVAQKTQNRILDLVPADVLNDATRMVLTNAIYFKSAWAENFEKSDTKSKPFKLADGKSADVPTMHQQYTFIYGESEGCQWIKIPYVSHQLSMVVVLPGNVDGLAALERTLTPQSLETALAGMKAELVTLALPKFKTESSFGLRDVLESMGMNMPFQSRHADFSGMTSVDRLFISQVIHKSFVEVNEEGTEAAAATAVIMDAGAPPQRREPKVFNADHPFLYMIRHESTKTILFMGRMVNPKG